MRVHLITNLFAPDELAGAALYTDMAAYLHEQGHDVRVTTTFSYYPAWANRPEDTGVALHEETVGDIPVRRIKMYVPAKASGLRRMLSDVDFLQSLLRRALFPGWTPEVVITASPMLSQCLAQRFLYLGRSIPRFIVVQDFVVDAALELGILRLPLISTALNAVQNWALRSAQTLSTISPMMLEKLRGKVGADRRLVFIPNWVHRSLQTEIDRQRALKPPRASNLLVYSGNFGRKQGLPDFLDQFRAVAGTGPGLDWHLEIHGGGAEKSELAAAIAGTTAVKLGGVQDEVDYVATLLRATACLVTQRPGVGANYFPSKLLPALATGTPVLAVCDANSPLGREILESGCGEVIPPGDNGALVAVLRRWSEQPALVAEMSRRSHERAASYERNHVLGQYRAELEALVAPGASRAEAAAAAHDITIARGETL